MGMIQDWAWKNRTDFAYEMLKETEKPLVEIARNRPVRTAFMHGFWKTRIRIDAEGLHCTEEDLY